MAQEFGSALNLELKPLSFYWAVVKTSPEVSTGDVGAAPKKQVCSHEPLRRLLFLVLWAFPRGYLSLFTTWQLTPSWSSDFRETAKPECLSQSSLGNHLTWLPPHSAHQKWVIKCSPSPRWGNQAPPFEEKGIKELVDTFLSHHRYHIC